MANCTGPRGVSQLKHQRGVDELRHTPGRKIIMCGKNRILLQNLKKKYMLHLFDTIRIGYVVNGHFSSCFYRSRQITPFGG